MGKNRSASGITNVIQYDNNGNIAFVSGSTTLMQVSSSGAITTTGVISGSNALSASFSLNSALLNGTGSVGFATTSSLLTVSSSQQQISASLLQVSASQQQLSSSFLTLTASFNAVSSSQQQISASYIALSASYNTFSGSASTRITENSSSIQQVSSSQQQISASLLNVISVFATTGSNSFRATQSITGSLTVTGQIIAQTLNVQQVTSSIIYSSGSNNFGCDLNSRQTFTGSVLITGSLTIAGASSATSYNGATIFGSTVICGASICTTGNTCFGGMSIINSCLGIGTSAPLSLLHIASADTDQGIRLTRANGTYGVRITRTGQIQAKLVDDVTFQTAISLSEGNASGSQHLILQPTAGKVGIGCLDSPTYHLEVRCAASVSSCYLVAMFARSTGANDGIGDIIAFGANGVSSIAGMYRSGGGSWGLELQTANQNTRMRIDNSGISCFACQLCAPVGIFSGCVSIGSTSPNYANLVLCNPSANSGNNSGLVIGRATSLPSAAADYGNIYLFSTDSYAADKGGTISFGSQYGSTGGDTKMSGIFGGKENATNGDYSGYLSFYTRLCGGFPAERVRITSNGSVGIGITSTGTNVKMKIKSATEGSGISLSSATLVIARCATDTQLGFGYYTTPDAWVISSTYGSDGAYKPLVLATSDVERFRICSNGNATFACSVNFNGNGSVTSKVGGVYNGTTTVTIGPSSWNGVMQIMVGVYGNGSGNTGRAMWIGGGYVGSGMPFTEVTRYCAGAVTIGALNANANCYTFTVGYCFPNVADISVTVIGTNANTVPATIEIA